MTKDPKHTVKTTQEFLKSELEYSSVTKPVADFKQLDQAVQLLRRKLKAEMPTNEQQRKVAGKKADSGSH